MISVIAAVARNGAIGRKGELIYWLPEDMKRFRRLTTGHTIIMGRKTFASLPKGALPNRRNIVLSRSVNALEGCDTYNSLEEALEHCTPNEEVFIIGGASVYEEALPMAQRLCLTEVDDVPTDADTFFPTFGSEWIEVGREAHGIDERHAFPFAFVDYERKE